MANLRLTRKEFGQLNSIAAYWIIYSAIRAGFCVLASMLLPDTAFLPQAKEMFDGFIRQEFDREDT